MASLVRYLYYSTAALSGLFPGDYYQAYNKPLAVYNWSHSVQPQEEWILILDADMIMRETWSASDYDLHRGLAMAQFYSYLKGVNNELALKHVPEVIPRNDTIGGPRGRRADMVGGI